MNDENNEYQSTGTYGAAQIDTGLKNILGQPIVLAGALSGTRDNGYLSEREIRRSFEKRCLWPRGRGCFLNSFKERLRIIKGQLYGCGSSWRFQQNYTDVTACNLGVVAAHAGYSLDETLKASGLYNFIMGNPQASDTIYHLQQGRGKMVTVRSQAPE